MMTGETEKCRQLAAVELLEEEKETGKMRRENFAEETVAGTELAFVAVAAECRTASVMGCTALAARIECKTEWKLGSGIEETAGCIELATAEYRLA